MAKPALRVSRATIEEIDQRISELEALLQGTEPYVFSPKKLLVWLMGGKQ